MNAEQAEFFDGRWIDAGLAVWASIGDDSSETRADFVLGPSRPAGPGVVIADLIDLREARKQWRDQVDWRAQPVEPAPVAIIPVPQPPSRHRGPRRCHVGVCRRPGSRRVTTGSRAGPRASDPDLGDEPPGHRPSALAELAAA